VIQGILINVSILLEEYPEGKFLKVWQPLPVIWTTTSTTQTVTQC